MNTARALTDGGLMNSNGKRFERVEERPGPGQYSSHGGIYTFSIDDAGATIIVTAEPAKPSIIDRLITRTPHLRNSK